MSKENKNTAPVYSFQIPNSAVDDKELQSELKKKNIDCVDGLKAKEKSLNQSTEALLTSKTEKMVRQSYVCIVYAMYIWQNPLFIVY